MLLHFHEAAAWVVPNVFWLYLILAFISSIPSVASLSSIPSFTRLSPRFHPTPTAVSSKMNTVNDNSQSLEPSPNWSDTEMEQRFVLGLHEGRDDDDLYENLLRECTHYPNDYYHVSSEALITPSPIQPDPLSFHVDDDSPTTLEGACFLPLPADLSPNQEKLREAASFTLYPSAPSPLKPFCDGDQFLVDSDDTNEPRNAPPRF